MAGNPTTFALVNSNVVTDITYCDQDFATTYLVPYNQYVVNIAGLNPEPKIGDTYNGSVFTITANPAPTPTVIQYVGQQVFPTFTLTDAATVSWNLNAAQAAKVTLAGNRTLSVSNPLEGSTYTLVCVQGAGGSHTLAYTSGQFIWPGGTAPTLSTAAAAIDVLTFICHTGLLAGSCVKAFA